MQDAVRSPLAAWETFYVIIGSSAAALTGLQFVVVALVAETRRRSTTGQIDAFATPTIVHFGAVLLVSAINCAPWPSLSMAGLALAICGCAGVGYVTVVFRRVRRQSEYQAVLEDWLWHIALPVIAYAALLTAAVLLRRHTLTPLFVIAATALLLLFVGIHNAWDTVTYIAVQLEPVQKPDAPSGPS